VTPGLTPVQKRNIVPGMEQMKGAMEGLMGGSSKSTTSSSADTSRPQPDKDDVSWSNEKDKKMRALLTELLSPLPCDNVEHTSISMECIGSLDILLSACARACACARTYSHAHVRGYMRVDRRACAWMRMHVRIYSCVNVCVCVCVCCACRAFTAKHALVSV
jgi:hypothetical protein